MQDVRPFVLIGRPTKIAARAVFATRTSDRAGGRRGSYRNVTAVISAAEIPAPPDATSPVQDSSRRATISPKVCEACHLKLIGPGPQGGDRLMGTRRLARRVMKKARAAPAGSDRAASTPRRGVKGRQGARLYPIIVKATNGGGRPRHYARRASAARGAVAAVKANLPRHTRSMTQGQDCQHGFAAQIPRFRHSARLHIRFFHRPARYRLFSDS